MTLDSDEGEPNRHPRGKGFDFWLEASGKKRFLNPQNGGKFGKIGAAEGAKEGCQRASYKRDRLRIDTLSAGSRVCFHSGLGRYALLTLENTSKSPSEQSQIAYVLWQ